MAQLLFQGLLIGDVAAVEHQPAHTWLVREVGHERLKDAPRPVRVTEPPLHSRLCARALHQEAHDVAPALLVSDMNRGHQRGSEAALRVPAEDPRDGRTLKQDGRVPVDDGDKVRGVLNQSRETGVTSLQVQRSARHGGLKAGLAGGQAPHSAEQNGHELADQHEEYASAHPIAQRLGRAGGPAAQVAGRNRCRCGHIHKGDVGDDPVRAGPCRWCRTHLSSHRHGRLEVETLPP